MADAVISGVLDRVKTILKEQIQNEVKLVRGVDSEIESLSKELENVRNKLEDAERKQFADKGVKAWLVRLEDASYEMEDVLDEWQIALRKFLIQQQQQSNAAPKNKVCSFISCLCFKKVAIRHDIATKIKNVKGNLDQILADKKHYGFNTLTTTQCTTMSEVDLAEVHERELGSDVVASKIFATTSPSQLETVSIVGVGGVGKTTLAQHIFNDSRVKDCFQLSIWICVSEPFNVAEIVKKIVESVTGRSPESNQLEVLVQVHLKACISRKKFLLVLDDVWTEDHTKCELLKNSLKSCCGIGSKILVTTRYEKVAKMLDTPENRIHHLRVLSDESCWLLLKRIALFGRDEEECAKYKDIGMKIAAKCTGLPLAAKTLGSMLRCKKELVEWENVLNSEIWKLEEAQLVIFPHLVLSYNELSPALKRCFSYCAVFPKDFEIVVEEVIGHWMALGYLGSDIGSGGGRDMEIRGQQYCDNLAKRSFFQDFRKDKQIESFKLHDIVHDFAQFLRKNGTAVVEAGTNKKTNCHVCSPYELVSQVKQYRTLFCDINNKDTPICGCLDSLRVLSLRGYSGIPQEIEKFIHLRWLDLSGDSGFPVWDLETICNELYNLQTLLLEGCGVKEIPKGIGNLINLRRLDLSWNEDLKELPREIGNLINLTRLDLRGNEDLKELPREIGNLINLTHLDLSEKEALEELPREIGKLINLRFLNLSWNGSLEELPREIGNLINLTHLDLSYNKSLKELPGEIGNLINLTHLDLSYNKSLKELPREIGYLINLRRLDLSWNEYLMELPREIGNLINLRRLDLSWNRSLHELPENICDMREMETLDIDYCSRLSKLPQGIHRLVNLEYLHNNGTSSLRQFPQGIAQLTCLRTLSEFRVGKDMGKLGWLKNLNRLGGGLRLRISLTVDVVEDARDGELRNKEYLEKLEIVFDDEIDIGGVEDCVWVDVLDALQPHPNLQGLGIYNFHGSRLPDWIASPLNQVKNIYLSDFGHLSSILLPLGKQPCLENMEIFRMPGLRFVGREFLHGITTQTETTIVFPKLKTLTFGDCPNWEEWEDITAQEEEEDEKVILFMPRLIELKITKCSSLPTLPHRLLCKIASSLERKKLDISGSTQLEQRYGDKEGSPWKSISHIN